MSGEGMVAVVQSLRDARLAVTLVDGSRNKYSLVPSTETELQAGLAVPQRYQTIHLRRQNSSAGPDHSAIRCDSGAQATDGRYTTHGNLEPTSPPCEVTEFPPQRAELCPGHGNFEVGGLGSGETGRTPIRPQQGTFRGGMCWMDRGSVFAPRGSQHPDAFANSLRKYPTTSVSPERSSEVLERLVTYSHAKNLSRTSGKATSPTRTNLDSDVSNQTYVERNPRRARCDDVRSRSRVDECPTRDGRPRREESEKRNYNRSYEIRCAREITRVKDNGRPNDFCQNRASDELSLSSCQRKFIANGSTNSVHTETQPISMCSKEVATIPRSLPEKKNVAVPYSASASTVGNPDTPTQAIPSSSQMEQNSAKIISFKSVQTSSSTTELTSAQKKLNPRKSKSEDDLKRQHFHEGLIELIGNMAVNSKAKDNVLNGNILKDMWIKLHKVLENVEKQNSRDKALINLGKKIRKAPVYIPFRNENVKDYCRTKIRKWTEMDVYHAAVPPFRMASVEDRIENIVKGWVNTLPIVFHHVERPNEMKTSDHLVREILKLIEGKAKIHCESLKKQVINVISLTPIELKGKRNIVHVLADGLLSELKNVAPNIFKKQSKFKSSSIKPHLHPSEDIIKEWISNEMVEFIEKFNLDLKTKDINEIKTDLGETLMNFIYEGGLVSEKVIKEDIISILSDYNIDNDHSNDLANALLNHIKQMLLSHTKYGDRNFIVCLNTSMKRHITPILNTPENLHSYKINLCEQIDEWLTDLPVEVLKFTSENARETIINDLAEEIVNRRKYLEFNSSDTSDENELEYLKYQIYKWINKVVGEENINIVEHASDLMEKIRDISVPQFASNANDQNVEARKEFSDTKESTNPRYMDVKDVFNSTTSKSRPSILKTCLKNQVDREQNESCSQSTQKTPRITIQSLNEEYEEYVKNWVHQIPIPATSPQEEELSEKLRMGLHNGIWKALTKLKFDPVTFNNTFYYQDLLDDEVESLLDSLPKSNELDAKKHVLKAQFLEHTTNTNGQLMKLAETASFKQNLVDNVANYVPRSNNDDINDPIKMHEDLQILSIVEDYILLTNYDEDNKTKANAFRKKLSKHVEGFVEQLKKTHGKELKDIDIGIYMNDIMETLHNVPLPSEESLKEEADEIMLGIEIEHWFEDLPLIPNDDYFEQLQRRRLRETLTKRINDIEKNNMSLCAAENLVNGEIKKFLEGAPLKPEERENIKFFADELSNRIKNKKREQTRKRSVGFRQNISHQQFQNNNQSPINQSKFFHSLPNAPAKYQTKDNQNKYESMQQPIPRREFQFHKERPNPPNFPGDKSKYFSYNPNSPVQYHPTPISNPNFNNSSLIGGGMLYNPREINSTLDARHDYHGFEGDLPLSSSMYSLPPNVYNNRSLQHPESLEDQRLYPLPYSAAAYAPDTSWVSLEQIPMTDELRKQLQLGTTGPQQMKSFIYSDSQSIPSNFIEQNQASCCATNKTENTSLPQVIQDQISRINEAAVGNFSNNRSNDISLGNNIIQGPAESSLGRTSDRVRSIYANRDNFVHASSRTLENSIRTRANMSNIDHSIIQPNVAYNQSLNRRNNEIVDQTVRSAYAGTPLAQIQQNLSNRMQQRSPSPRVTQHSQLSAQNISELLGPDSMQTSQRILSMPSVPTATPQQIPPQIIPQRPVQNIPQISEPQPITDQEQNRIQPSGSSYGQPQGFSTPNQGINQRSPPRIGRKKHDPLRFRSGPARRRLDLDDSDESEEDCPCMTRLKRRPCDGLDYPCFYPFPCPHPYFF